MATPDATSSQPAHARLRLRYSARSDVGLVRQGNEDSGYAGGHMLVVADGMGGHAAGELASATVIAMFAELDREPPGAQVLTAMADAVDEAHDELSRIIAAAPDFAGMGTTVTAMSWEGDRVALAHVGDSRAYLLRAGELTQLTKDHTFVQSLVDSGRITYEEAAVHQKRNLLMKALDGVHQVEPDLSIREARAGDRFLLCSDGLSGVLSGDELRSLLSTQDTTGAATALVERALEEGAPDNVTCVVADLVADDHPNDTVTDHPSNPPMPVVVGAAAELRNRDRLPGIEFPDDSQPDPDRPTPEPTAEAEPQATTEARRRRPGRWVIVGLAGVAIALAGLIAVWGYIQNQYYVGSVDGNVGIYQGVTWGPGDHGFSSAIQTSPTRVDELPLYAQEQVRATIPASGLSGARDVLSALEDQAAQCADKPKTQGCPKAEPQPTVPPTPTTAPISWRVGL